MQPCDFVEALDVRDGSRVWEYRRERVDHAANLACVNRNGALYGDRLFIATHDAHLVALDARTGEVEWDVAVGDWTIGQHYSGGPMIIKGAWSPACPAAITSTPLLGVGPRRRDRGRGVADVHDSRPRRVRLRELGGRADEDRRGGSAWNSPSFDPGLNLIYTGVGVPIPWGSVQRGTGDGDVLYTNSTLALDADTGEIVWYFQHIPNDEWDLDHPFARLVVETRSRPATSSGGAARSCRGGGARS